MLMKLTSQYLLQDPKLYSNKYGVSNTNTTPSDILAYPMLS